MIKKTLYFGNPAYLSLKNKQLVVKLPEVEKNDLPDVLEQHYIFHSVLNLLSIQSPVYNKDFDIFKPAITSTDK